MLPKALKSCPKCKKSPNLVTLTLMNKCTVCKILLVGRLEKPHILQRMKLKCRVTAITFRSPVVSVNDTTFIFVNLFQLTSPLPQSIECVAS